MILVTQDGAVVKRTLFRYSTLYNAVKSNASQEWRLLIRFSLM